MGNLITLRPVLSPLLWTAIATGKRPYYYGVLGFPEVTPDGGAVQPVSQRSRRTKAPWNILNQQGLRSIVVGWWPSWPDRGGLPLPRHDAWHAAGPGRPRDHGGDLLRPRPPPGRPAAGAAVDLGATFQRQLSQVRAWLALQPHSRTLRIDNAEVIAEPRRAGARIAAFLGRGLDGDAMADVVDAGLYRERQSTGATLRSALDHAR
jgi:hypothetical protein